MTVPGCQRLHNVRPEYVEGLGGAGGAGGAGVRSGAGAGVVGLLVVTVLSSWQCSPEICPAPASSVSSSSLSCLAGNVRLEYVKGFRCFDHILERSSRKESST